MDPPAVPKLLLLTIEFNAESMSMKSTSDAVCRALEKYGCFVIEYEETSLDLHGSMFQMSEELFGLPVETKTKHILKLQASVMVATSQLCPSEYFGIQHHATDLRSKKDLAALIWPRGNHHFCEVLHSYCNLVWKLERAVMRMLCSSYGLEGYYEPLTATSFHMARVMRYGAPCENESSIGIIPHRDKNFLAVIGTNHVPGLEIQTPYGDWISFHPSPTRFIVIVGEALIGWSNGRLFCPLHKVVARGTQEKYSVAIFSFVRGVVSVPEEFVDDENPLKFKPFNHQDFLDYCKDGGPKMTAAIHAYCGLP